MDDKLDIRAEEVRNLINKLRRFLGYAAVEKSLRRYRNSLQSSGPVVREYYLRNRHPWWGAFIEYFELERSGKSIKRNLTTGIKLLAADGKRISILQEFMPEKVREKYKRDLVDDKRAYDYLFEIHIAWHFYSKGCEIQWHKDDSRKHPEFIAKSQDFQFNVECKRISVDIARKIHRKDFYGFADKLIPEIEKRNYAGKLDFTLKDRLKSGAFGKLCAKALKVIDGGILDADCEIAPFGSLALDLSCCCHGVIDMNERWNNFYERKPDNAHGTIFARSKSGRPVDPIELTVMSEKADTVLDGIKDRISRAETQLDESKPGLIACFLEGVNGFELDKLKSKSGLQLMTNDLLAKDKFSHIAGISYSSESMVKKGWNSEEIFNSALFFRNHKCKFKEAKTFKFMSPPRF